MPASRMYEASIDLNSRRNIGEGGFDGEVNVFPDKGCNLVVLLGNTEFLVHRKRLLVLV